MKQILLMVILTITQSAFAQNDKVDSVMMEANLAFQNSDFNTAKENYLSLIKIDSVNKNAYFNLGATYLKLGQNDKACGQLQKAYSYGDMGAYDVIIQYCGELKYSDRMFPDHVDELPKFKYNGEFVELILRKNKYQKEINPAFIDFLRTELKKNKNLKKIRDKFFIRLISVTKDGELQTEIKGNLSTENKAQIMAILKNKTDYYPAVYKDQKVELFGGGFTLPVSMK